MKEEAQGCVILLLLLCGFVAAFAADQGMFYTTGKQWFDSCWTAQHSKRQAASPEEAVSWGKCEKTAAFAVFEAGFMFADDPGQSITGPARAVAAACPSSWSDLPIGGIAVLGVNLVEQDGGPSFLDRFTPASRLIGRAYRKKWPGCPAARLANHFPRLVPKPGGEFGWDGPCQPCVVEERARAARPATDVDS